MNTKESKVPFEDNLVPPTMKITTSFGELESQIKEIEQILHKVHRNLIALPQALHEINQLTAFPETRRVPKLPSHDQRHPGYFLSGVATNTKTWQTDSVFISEIVDGQKKICPLNLSDIIYIKSDGNYTTIVTTQTQHRIKRSLRHWEDKLRENNAFFRIHQSFIINIHKIKEYTLSTRKITMVDGTKTIVSIRFASMFLMALEH